MRGVLVDNDDAVLCLCDDIVFMNLPTRRPQRVVRLLRILGGFDHGVINAGGWRGGLCKTKVFGRLGLITDVAHRGAGAVHLIDRLMRDFGSHCTQCRARNRGRCAVSRLAQCVAQGGYNQSAHQARFAKAHLGFGGMHVHINKVRVAIHKQCNSRVAIT